MQISVVDLVTNLAPKIIITSITNSFVELPWTFTAFHNLKPKNK